MTTEDDNLRRQARRLQSQAEKLDARVARRAEQRKEQFVVALAKLDAAHKRELAALATRHARERKALERKFAGKPVAAHPLLDGNRTARRFQLRIAGAGRTLEAWRASRLPPQRVPEKALLSLDEAERYAVELWTAHKATGEPPPGIFLSPWNDDQRIAMLVDGTFQAIAPRRGAATRSK